MQSELLITFANTIWLGCWCALMSSSYKQTWVEICNIDLSTGATWGVNGPDWDCLLRLLERNLWATGMGLSLVGTNMVLEDNPSYVKLQESSPAQHQKPCAPRHIICSRTSSTLPWPEPGIKLIKGRAYAHFQVITETINLSEHLNYMWFCLSKKNPVCDF